MRTRELTLAVAASMCCAAAAQYEPDTLKPLPPVCDVFVLPGGQLESMYAVGIEQWRKLAPAYREAAQQALRTVAESATLSSDTREIIERALAD